MAVHRGIQVQARAADRRGDPRRATTRKGATTPRPSRPLVLLAQQLAVLATACLVTLVAVSVVLNRDEIAPGVSLLDVPVGGLSLDEARQRVAMRADELHGQRVIIRYGDKTWKPTLEDLGVTYDSDAGLRRALSIGHGRDIIGGLSRWLGLGAAPVQIDVPIQVDTGKLGRYGERRMKELGLAPVDADLQVDGVEVSITPDMPGLVVDPESFKRDLMRELTGFTAPSVDLQPMLRPAKVRAADLEPELRTLDGSFSQPLTLRTSWSQWQIAPAELVTCLEITLESNRGRLAFDPEAIEGFADRVIDEIDTEERDAEVDETGPYARLVTSTPGRQVDRPELIRRIHMALSTGLHEVEIPLSETPVEVTTNELLDDLGITTLIAVGSTSFADSTDGRAANIRLAAKRLDGVLIPAGQQLSLNTAIGPVTAEEGFVPAGAAEGGFPGWAPGGGVGQMATTFFRAALLGGLQIDAWTPYPVRNVLFEQGGWGPGADAMIVPAGDGWEAGADLVVTNNTDGWLRVRALVGERGTLTIELSGIETGLYVVLSQPIYLDVVGADLPSTTEVDATLPVGETIEWQPARDGVTMLIVRSIYEEETGAVVLEEEWVSTYEPAGAVLIVGDEVPDTDASTGEDAVDE